MCGCVCYGGDVEQSVDAERREEARKSEEVEGLERLRAAFACVRMCVCCVVLCVCVCVLCVVFVGEECVCSVVCVV